MKNKDNYKHGMAGSRIYNIWNGMKQRCNNKNHWAYKYYGGRGIGYVDGWEKFIVFYRDMLPSYRNGLTLERIDNNRDYSKNNCKWVSLTEQARNRSSNVFLTHKGKTKNISEWEEIVGISQHTISYRIRKGWSIKNALTKKPKKVDIRRKINKDNIKIIINSNIGQEKLAKIIGVSQSTISKIKSKYKL